MKGNDFMDNKFKINPVTLVLFTLFIVPDTVSAEIKGEGIVTGSTSSVPASGDWIDYNNSVGIGYNGVRSTGGIESSSLDVSGATMTAKSISAGNGYVDAGIIGQYGQYMSLSVRNSSTLTLNSLSSSMISGWSSFSAFISGQSLATIGSITGPMSLGVSGLSSLLNATSVSLGQRSSLSLLDGGVLRSRNRVQLGANSTLTIGSSSATGGTLDAPEVTLGTGAVIDFRQTNPTYTFLPSITGAGGVNINASGNTVLSGTNTYTGATRILNGTLLAGAQSAFSEFSDYTIYSAGTLDNAGLQGQMKSVLNNGAMRVYDNEIEISKSYSGQGSLEVSGNSGVLQVGEGIQNSGTILIHDGALLADTGLLSANRGYINVDGAVSKMTFKGLFDNSGSVLITDGATASASILENNGGIVVVQGAGSALAVTNQLTNTRTLQLLDGATASAGTVTNNGGGILISGNESELSASAISSTGTILVNDGGNISAPLITLTSSGTLVPSTLNIGSVSQNTAGQSGNITADRIQLDTSGSSRASVNFNHTDSGYIFSPAVTGNGDINVESGTTIFSGANTFSGTTTVSGGALVAGIANTFSPNSDVSIASAGLLSLDGFSQTLGDTVNAGTISLAGSTAGAVLTVDGDYTGNNGTLLFGTELGDDSATSDRLVVNGDVTGTTNVRVSNLGGSGAETLNGIELIEVQGNADSNAFRQAGRIVAGAYDYWLVRGDQNWYLTSRIDLETGLPIIGDGEGENPGGGGENPGGGGENPGSGESPGGGETVMVLRPESGAYAANLATASRLFDTRMSDRQGTWYLDPLTGEEKHTSLWLRVAGDHNRLNAGSGQLRTRTNSVVTMLGGDVAATDSARLGLMAGYGNSRSNTQSDLTGYRAKGQINGYTTGLYGTWFAEGTDERGLWADSTLQYSWFNNSVDGEDEAGEHYKSKGVSASVSAGYVIPLGTGERTAFFLQPQARAGWSGIKADDHTERNGTRVQGSGQDNVSTSIGIKAFMKSHAALDDNTGRQFGMFTEANWIHNSKEYGVRMDSVTVSQQGSRNIAEARIGLDGALGGGLGIKGSIGQQVGDRGWSDTSAALSVNYRF